MNLWLISYNLYLISSLPSFIKWLYLWQKKEYRGDKMFDYLTTPEGRKILFDKWLILRTLTIYLLWLSTQFNTFGFLDTITTLNKLRTDSLNFSLEFSLISNLSLFFLILISVLMLAETLEFLYKLLIKKNLLLPEKSNKLLLHITLSSLSLVLIPILFVNFRLISFVYTLNFMYLLIPLVIGYWLLAVFPIDWIIKNRLFEKAKRHRQALTNLKIIAVSGSYGKTSTKDILHQLLSLKYQTERTLKNQNSNVSCARKLLSLSPETEYFVCELGSYRLGDGNEICKFLLPNISVITGLNQQHLALFGTNQKVVEAESESLRFLPTNSLVVVNWCSKLNRQIDFNPDHKVIKIATDGFGVDKDEVDYFADNIQLNNQNLETSFNLYIASTKKSLQIKTNLLSDGNIQNFLQALAIALELGISLEEILSISTKLEQPKGTLEITKSQSFTIINDSYNANFDGILNAVKLLAQLNGKKILILDDILELGKEAVSTHIKLANQLMQIHNHNKLDKIILVGRNYAQIVSQELANQGFISKNLVIIGDNKERLNKVANWLNELKNQAIIKNVTPVNVLFEGRNSQKLLKMINYENLDK